MRILVISPKEVYFAKRLKLEAELAGAQLDIFSAFELAEKDFAVDVAKYKCLYVRFCYPYFSSVATLANKFAQSFKPVVDVSVLSGSFGINKWSDYQLLFQAGLPQPQTQKFSLAEKWQHPSVFKWMHGFAGKEVFLVKDIAAVQKITELFPSEELLVQEFIEAEFEYKVITAGFKALPVVLRFGISQKNFRPDFNAAVPMNVPAGNKAVRQVVSLAEQASRILGRELCKIDILQKGEKFYILEANRWPGLKSFEELTGYNAVKQFFDYLAQK